MKKILLGTTGLVAVALLATAASAETPKVTLGGFSDFQAGITGDDKDGAAVRSTGFRNDNEITVKVDGKSDAGLGYGAEIDLEADSTADADNQGVNASRTFTYLEGGWGRVELGGNKSAAANLRVDASTLAAATGGINGSWTYFVNGTGAGANQLNNAANAGFVTTSKLPSEHGSANALGDESTYNATKVTYYTPKFAGFQAGASYTPQLGDRGQTVARSNIAGLTDVIDLGLGYEGTFSGVKVAAAGTYETASATGAAAAASAGYGTEDVNAWNLGALVGYQGFSLAGSYANADDTGKLGSDAEYWTLGLGYTAGPVGVSATYLASTVDYAGSTADNDFQNIVLGAEYKLAPGLTPYAEVSFYDFDANQSNAAAGAYNNTGTTLILGTQVAF
ncbi:MAG: porin [Pseudomonadota bacterium]